MAPETNNCAWHERNTSIQQQTHYQGNIWNQFEATISKLICSMDKASKKGFLRKVTAFSNPVIVSLYWCCVGDLINGILQDIIIYDRKMSGAWNLNVDSKDKFISWFVCLLANTSGKNLEERIRNTRWERTNIFFWHVPVGLAHTLSMRWKSTNQSTATSCAIGSPAAIFFPSRR